MMNSTPVKYSIEFKNVHRNAQRPSISDDQSSTLKKFQLKIITYIETVSIRMHGSIQIR